MRATIRRVFWTGLASWMLGAAVGAASLSWIAQESRPRDADQALAWEVGAVANWPEQSRQAALGITAKYGPADSLSPLVLAWNDKGPWKWILVYRDAGASGDVLQQFVRYEAPVDRRWALPAFGHGVAYDAAGKELSARSDSEEKNILALNLADEIAHGADIEAARRLNEKTLDLSLSGKSSPSMQRLLFKTGDGTSMENRRP